LGETYRAAGVDLSAADDAVRRISPHVRATFRPEVLGDIGGFGGLFAFPAGRYREPVLVSSTDGVGTKVLVARATGRFDTIGVDLVAMSVDDIAAQGAEPLFFLDYIGVGRLDPAQIEDLVAGVSRACIEAGCALVGGEIAEHPGAGGADDLELAGFAVGVVERSEIVTGAAIEAGDRLIGLSSPGLRSNGYSLARRVLLDVGGRRLEDDAWPGAGHTLADELLRPSVIYAPAVNALCRAVAVRGMAHITGGGLPGNLSRILPAGLDAVVNTGTWDVPAIFEVIREAGNVEADEMARVFNLGIGMVAVVPPHEAARALDHVRAHGHGAFEIGEVVTGSGRVVLRG
jgi:phosphoribosylformylglycinamidine cyclo-ligase